MKKTLLTSLATLCVVALFAQQPVKWTSEFARTQSAQRAINHVAVQHNEMAPSKNASIVMGGDIIGHTYYDQQTNYSMPQKVYAHNDGTVSAVWTTCGTSTSSRGTGYNYFNGTSWTQGVGYSAPTSRIESVRTGWGVISGVGTNGEIVVSHNGTDALVIGLRAQKGTGDWTFTTLAGPQASNGSSTSTCLLWPSIATSGNTIHLIACTESDEGYLYQGINTCLVYIRGTYDQASNTVSWESPRVVADASPAIFSSFSGDQYSIAANGNNVAVFVADRHHDAFIWKSTDNGTTFNTITVVNTAVPDGYDDNFIIDTTGSHGIYTSDGSCSIAIGNDGVCHVAFGIMKWANPEAGDGYITLWPYTDGLLYWNENMDPILGGTDDQLNPDTLMANGYQVFQRLDLDGDGSVWIYNGDYMTENYSVTMTSTPQLTVDNGNVYMVFTTFLDVPFADHVNSMYYRGVFGTKSTDNGATWNNGFSWLSYNNRCYYIDDWSSYDTSDLEASMELIYNEGESMYPTIAKNIVNGKLNMWWQQDYFADNNGGNLASDPADIFFFQLDADQLGAYNNTEEIPQGLWIDNTGVADNTLEGMKLYPNPASENVNISFTSSEMANATLTVCNLMGQVVYSENIAVSEGSNLVCVNTKAFSAGVYTVNIRTNKGTSTQKLIVR